ncbi:MAG: murein hydrolase activator EnvC family protein [Candidatus Aquicultorales bacterium]
MRTHLSRRLVAVLAIFFVTAALPAPALADRGSELQAQLEQIQREIENTKAQIDGNRAQQSGVVQEITDLDREMGVLVMEIKTLTDELDATVAERTATEKALADLKTALENTLKELEQAKARLVKQKKILNDRVRNIYVNGTMSYAAVLLNSSSFGDFVSRASFLNFIANQDANLVAQVKQTKQTVEKKEAEQRQERSSIEQKQAALVEQEKAISVLKTEQESKMAALGGRKTERQAVVASLQQDEASLASLEDEEVAASDWVAGQINEWNAQVREEARRRAEEEARRREAEAAAAAAAAQPAAPATGGGGSAEPAPYVPPAPVSEWVWPAGSMWDITSNFGWRIHPITGVARLHAGVDIGLPEGTPIKAGHSGVVSYAGWAGGYGLYTVIENGDGISTAYAHQSYIAVNVGDWVSGGQVIGYIGNTGASTGAHLHYEIYVDGVPYNPLDWY